MQKRPVPRVNPSSVLSQGARQHGRGLSWQSHERGGGYVLTGRVQCSGGSGAGWGGGGVGEVCSEAGSCLLEGLAAGGALGGQLAQLRGDRVPLQILPVVGHRDFLVEGPAMPWRSSSR